MPEWLLLAPVDCFRSPPSAANLAHCGDAMRPLAARSRARSICGLHAPYSSARTLRLQCLPDALDHAASGMRTAGLADLWFRKS